MVHGIMLCGKCRVRDTVVRSRALPPSVGDHKLPHNITRLLDEPMAY